MFTVNTVFVPFTVMSGGSTWLFGRGTGTPNTTTGRREPLVLAAKAEVAVTLGPVGPVGPVAPVAPVAPAGPVAPAAPAGPVAPAAPVGPVGPVEPSIYAQQG